MIFAGTVPGEGAFCLHIAGADECIPDTDAIEGDRADAAERRVKMTVFDLLFRYMLQNINNM